MINRRDFLKLCASLSVAVSGSDIFSPEIAMGFNRIFDSEKPSVAFIQGQCCTGCTISLTYGNETSFSDFINTVISLQVHPSLSAVQGRNYLEQMEKLYLSDDYCIVIEGSIPAKMKTACKIGGVAAYDYIEKFLRRAKMIFISGTCANFGGIPASGKNLTGAVSVPEYMAHMGINTPYIKLPGCPVQPDRLMGTVSYFTATGQLPLSYKNIPLKYYPDIIHNHCGRFQYFNQGIYLEDYSDDKTGCLMKKGCRGTITRADCPTRRWNGKVNVCIESNTPCVGCINEKWPFDKPLYIESSEIIDILWDGMKKKIESLAK